jgi:hypothetical protein
MATVAGKRRSLEVFRPVRAGRTRLTVAVKPAAKFKRIAKTALRCIELAGGLLVLGILFQIALTHPYFQVKKIEITGNSHLKKSQIESAIGFLFYRNIFTCDVDGAAAVLKQNPWIKSVAVNPVAPDNVRVVIRERKPVAVVESGGRLFLVGGDGYLLEKVNSRESYLEVSVSDEQIGVGDRVERTGIEKAVKLASLFAHDRLFSDPVVSVHLIGSEQIAAETSGGVRIVLGMEEKMWKEKFLEYLTVRKILSERGNSFMTIDLSFNGQAVMTPGTGHNGNFKEGGGNGQAG